MTLVAYVAVLSVFAAAGSATPPAGDAVRIFSSASPEYAQLDIPDSLRVAPEAASRLVLFRGGVAVLDRGLALDVEVVPKPGGSQGARVEQGYVEDAEVSPDGGFAILLATRYKKTLSLQADAETKGKTELTWIDPAHPKGLWSVAFEDGIWVKRVLLLSSKQGIAVSTIADPNGPADLRLYNAEGVETMRLRGEEASVVDMRPTTHAAFLAVDLAYPERSGVPDRGVLVLDLLHGRRWTYTWSYGDEHEPMSWNLADTGILEVTTPDGLRLFDRNGKPLRASRQK